jgi:hypothetical protein
VLRDIPTRYGSDRDEYSPAVGRGRGTGLTRGTHPPGWKADVRYVPSAENRSHGSVLGIRLRRFCDGTPSATSSTDQHPGRRTGCVTGGREISDPLRGRGASGHSKNEIGVRRITTAGLDTRRQHGVTLAPQAAQGRLAGFERERSGGTPRRCRGVPRRNRDVRLARSGAGWDAEPNPRPRRPQMSTLPTVRAAIAALLSAPLALLLIAGSALAATDHVVITGAPSSRRARPPATSSSSTVA